MRPPAGFCLGHALTSPATVPQAAWRRALRLIGDKMVRFVIGAGLGIVGTGFLLAFRHVAGEARKVLEGNGASTYEMLEARETAGNAKLTQSLTPEVLSQRYIDALKEIGASGNLVVVPEGSTPMVSAK